MRIHLSPRLDGAALSIEVAGETITLNGETLDFSDLGSGETLAQYAREENGEFKIDKVTLEPVMNIHCRWIAGDVMRDAAGMLHVPVFLPHSGSASEAARFPQPIDVTEDGPVTLPT